MRRNFKLVCLILILVGWMSFTVAPNNQRADKNDDFNITVRNASPAIPFVYGVKSGPLGLDPHYVWDLASQKVLDQVCEGLYTYNLSDPELTIIPNLAVSHGSWSLDALNYTVPLRMGVTFHDGTPFNASAVKFSFDRLAYFMNATGNLPLSTPISLFDRLYQFSDGAPIINRTEILDIYTIRFVLNAPFASFQALLCFSGSYIISLLSTPATDYIDLNWGDLIGTGPFVYDLYELNVEAKFHAYDNYWGGKADIEDMTFSIIPDPYDRIAALINGDVHFIDDPLPSYLDVLEQISDITLLDQGKYDATIQFLGMNNAQINIVWREAIVYALDYDYIINEFYEGNAARLKSPIPKGLRYANSTFDYPIFNLTRARMAVQTMGYGLGFDLYSDAEWVYQEATAPFATFNYTYDIGNNFRENILYLLKDNLAKVGIRVTDAGMTLTDYINNLYQIGGGRRIRLQLFWFSQRPYYNDPYYILNELLDNSSYIDRWIRFPLPSNFVHYNGGRGRWGLFYPYGPFPYDPNKDVQLLMEAALVEMDNVARESLYDQIQQQTTEIAYPYAWGVVEKLYHAHHVNLSGFQQNCFKKVYFYPCEWNLEIPLLLDITHPVDITYVEGSTGHMITWVVTTNTELNTSYAVFRNFNQVDSGSWKSGMPIVINVDSLTAGNYAFRIEACNNGKLIEDTVIIIVTAEDDRIPGFPFWLVIIVSLSWLFYLSKKARERIQKY
ncbi:MAG: ABC transporter substrate-binding protein [Promethearchaeota archaeon]